MGINLKGIEAKLNEFNNKLNEIGDQVSDALNSGFSSFDETLNSVVGSFDEATDNLAVKYDEMKSKNENKEEKEIVTPFDNSNNFAEDVSEVTSVNHTVKPSISSEISSENGSVLNESSIDEGLFVGGVDTPIPVPVIEESPVEIENRPVVVLDKVDENIEKIGEDK